MDRTSLDPRADVPRAVARAADEHEGDVLPTGTGAGQPPFQAVVELAHEQPAGRARHLLDRLHAALVA